MDQNFQTSFIPKKPMIEQTVKVKRPPGLFLVSAIIIFLVMVVVAGGAYFYKNVLTGNVAQMESDLNLARNRFEPTEINKLKLLDRRLQASSDILSKHIAISPIFEALDALTLKTIRYTKFSYDFINNKIIVTMSGQAVGYRSIALQADLFTKNKNIIDPNFSNLTLDDQGNVLFDLQFSVDPSFVDYNQVLKITNETLPSSASSITTPNPQTVN
jgi:hypothetical protein